jgi:hypothetical protein
MADDSNNFEKAIELAKEWGRAADAGDAVRCEHLRRAIEEMVGRWEGNRWSIPAAVIYTMRLG